MPRSHTGECDCFEQQIEAGMPISGMCNAALQEWLDDIKEEAAAFPHGEKILYEIRDSVTAELLSRGQTPEGV
jgi:hypothetical protein